MSRSRRKTRGTRAAASKPVAAPNSAPAAVVDASAGYAEASRLGSLGQYDDARRSYADLEGSFTTADSDIRLRALVQNDLAVIAAMEGRFEEALLGWDAALAIDGDCLVARLNRDLIEAELQLGKTSADAGELKLAPAPWEQSQGDDRPMRLDGNVAPGGFPGHPEHGRPGRVAILSFLFNWPSTGGGNHHTAELALFLGRAGYEVRHFFARYEGWGIGRVTEDLIITRCGWPTLPTAPGSQKGLYIVISMIMNRSIGH